MSLFQDACGAVGPLKVSVRHGEAPVEEREFPQPFLVIGREPKTDLPLNDPAVSYRHAYLQVIDGQVYCVDLFTRTGTRWGAGLRPAGWLRPDQPIDIGPFTLHLPNPTDPSLSTPADPMASRPRDQDPLPPVSLEILFENQTVVWPMNRALALVGLEPRCKVHLKAAGVSAVHCSLVRTPKGLFVVDLNSSAGTTLNGTPIRWAHLAEGDELRVGEMRLRVNYPTTRQSVRPGSTPDLTWSGVFVQTPAEEEKLRNRLDELTRSLAAAEEDRAGLIRSGEEAARRWEDERRALRQEREAEAEARRAEQATAAELQAQVEAERQRAEAALAALRTQAEEDQKRLAAEADAIRAELAAQRAESAKLERAASDRAALEAQFQEERQTFQGQVAALLQEASELEQRHRKDVARAGGTSDQQRKALRDEVERLKREAERLRSERDQAAARLTAAGAEADALRAEASAREQERQRELAAVRDELAQVRLTAEAEAESLRREREAEAEATRRECEEAAAKLTTTRAEVEAIRRERDEVATQLAAARAEVDAVRTEVALLTDLSAREQHREQQREDELAAVRKELSRQRLASQDEAEKLRREREELASQFAATQTEIASLRTELAVARAEVATREDNRRRDLAAVRDEAETLRRERDLAVQALQDELAARRDFDQERQTLTAELEQVRQAAEDRRADCERQGAQAAARERQAVTDLARERQALQAEADEWRKGMDALRTELAVAQQKGQAEVAALRAEAEQESQRLAAESEALRRDAEALRVQLAAERSLSANLQRDRQVLQDEAVAHRKEAEALRHRIEVERQEQLAQLSAIGPDPALAKLTEQFRAAVGRFAGLVEQVESLYAELRERSQRAESKRGVFARFLGGSREVEEETNAALERRLATLRADVTIEEERTALLAAEAARADLERQLAEARRQLQFLNGRS